MIPIKETISNEQVRNKNELIRILQKTNNNNEIYIYDKNTDEYYYINSIQIDTENDLIIQVGE